MTTYLLRHGQRELYRSHLPEGKLFEETMMFWALGRVLSKSNSSCWVEDLFFLDFVSKETSRKSVQIPELSKVSFYRAVILGVAEGASTPASVKEDILAELERHKVCCVFPDAAYNSPQDFSVEGPAGNFTAGAVRYGPVPSGAIRCHPARSGAVRRGPAWSGMVKPKIEQLLVTSVKRVQIMFSNSELSFTSQKKCSQPTRKGRGKPVPSGTDRHGPARSGK